MDDFHTEYRDGKPAYRMDFLYSDSLDIKGFLVRSKDSCIKDGVTYDDEGIYTESVPYDEAEVFDAFAQKTDVDPKELKKLTGGEARTMPVPELAATLRERMKTQAHEHLPQPAGGASRRAAVGPQALAVN